MKIALIIPAYKPARELLALLEQFGNNGEFLPIVVDDGSGADYKPIFDALPEGVALLRHPENRGKGAALKTAFRHVLDACPQCDLAVTADADGQHRYEDILRVCQTARKQPDALVLGSRKFEGEVPLRSRLGNGITRQVFGIASGVKVFDTQTGLRAFGREAMRRFAEVPGDRYEYEINMLLTAAQSGMPIVEEWIETVYLNDNASSHFNPLRDSLKIYMCILKFSASSLLAFVVDYVLALILRAVTGSLWPEPVSRNFSIIVARIVSGTVNFTVNRRIVFKGDERLGRAILKYVALAAVILALNLGLMQLFTMLGLPFALGKIITEALLFCLSFVVQGKFVFRRKRG